MAYSMLSRPKLHNAKHIKYHPECEHPLDPNYHHHQHSFEDNTNEITVHNVPKKHKNPKGTSLRTRTSSDRKCPIYVHKTNDSFPGNLTQAYKKVDNYLDELYNFEEEPHLSTKAQTGGGPSKTNDRNRKAVITKLEESYWAHWKPQKEQSPYCEKAIPCKTTRSKHQAKKQKGKSKKQIDYDDQLETMVGHYSQQNSEIMEHNPDERPRQYSSEGRLTENNKKLSDSQEVQTEFSVKNAETLSKIDEEYNLDTTMSCQTVDIFDREDSSRISDSKDGGNVIEANADKSGAGQVPVGERATEPDEEDFKRLKHTDSVILTKKKQNEDKTRYQQPKYIRLYKKPGPTTTSGLVRGGSYPLKSCLKKESSIGAKRNIRLGKPGCPLIVTSNCNNVSKSFRK